jgi:large subunit ribosomal protein L25
MGAVMDIVAHEIEVEGPANQIPEHLEVDVTLLGIHDHVTAADIPLPPGFTLLSPPDTLVVTIEPPRTHEEEAAPAEGPAEPQVIGAEPAAPEGKGT